MSKTAAGNLPAAVFICVFFCHCHNRLGSLKITVPVLPVKIYIFVIYCQVLPIYQIARFSRQEILNIPVYAVHTALSRF